MSRRHASTASARSWRNRADDRPIPETQKAAIAAAFFFFGARVLAMPIMFDLTRNDAVANEAPTSRIAVKKRLKRLAYGPQHLSGFSTSSMNRSWPFSCIELLTLNSGANQRCIRCESAYIGAHRPYNCCSLLTPQVAQVTLPFADAVLCRVPTEARRILRGLRSRCRRSGP